MFAAFGNCRIRDKDESDVQKLCEDIDHCLILAASIAVMASAERHCSEERRHPHKQVCTLEFLLAMSSRTAFEFWQFISDLNLSKFVYHFLFCSLLWAAGAWSMNIESSRECWMPPINGLKGFCCCNCRMYSWWGGSLEQLSCVGQKVLIGCGSWSCSELWHSHWCWVLRTATLIPWSH